MDVFNQVTVLRSVSKECRRIQEEGKKETPAGIFTPATGIAEGEKNGNWCGYLQRTLRVDLSAGKTSVEVIFQERAPHLVYLWIRHGKVGIRDELFLARKKDVWETEDGPRKELCVKEGLVSFTNG